MSSGTQFAVVGDADGLFIDMQGILWALPAEGGNALPLTAPDDDIRAPQLSPDGQWIAGQSFARGSWDITVLRRDGSAQRWLTNGPQDDRDPAWSPDGRTIWFASDRTGNYDIWSIDIATGALQQITDNPADDYGPAAAAGQLAFVSERSGKPELYLLAMAGNRPTAALPERLAAAPAGKMYAPSFSPEGSRIAFVQARQRNPFPSVAQNELVMLSLDSRKSEVMSRAGSDVFSVTPAWLDASTLLYAADGRIQQLGINSGTITTLPFRATLSLQTNVFKARLPLAFSTATQPVLGIVDPVEDSAGRSIFAALGDLWALGADGALLQLTNDAFVDRDPSVSMDGRHLAWISDRNNGVQVWIRDLQTGAEWQLTENSTGPRYPTFSPTGEQLAYQQVGPRGTQDFTLRIVDMATGKSDRLRSAPAIWPGRMGWSADGSHLIIAELFTTSARFGDGRNRLIRINVADDTAAVATLPGELTPDSGPVIAPNGQFVALVINGSLWRAPLTTDGRLAGRPEQVLDELVDSPAWSHDSQRLIVLTNRGLESIAADGSQRALRNPALTWSTTVQPGMRIVHTSRLFDGRGDAYQRNMDILIDGARIISVEPHREHPAGMELIDATNMTVTPGLIDHHVHFEAHQGEWLGRSLLAYGVTTVVEPGGLPYESREHLETWASGRQLGPRIVYAGPQLDGERRTFYFGAHIRSEQRLRWELQRADLLGYGLLKAYRRLPPGLQAKTVELGHAQGLPVTAHAAFRNLGFGGDRSEHLRGSSRLAYSPKQSELLNSYADVQSIFSATGAAVTPTLVNQGGYFDYALKNPDIATNRQYVTLYSAAYRQGLAGFTRVMSKNMELIRAGLNNAHTSIRNLHNSDVTIVAGTDSPIFPYGLALIIELSGYVDAGLSPAAALRTATSDAARTMGAGDAVGTIAPGFLADLSIVDGDPLSKIDDMLNVTGIVKNGRYFTLDELLMQPK